MTPAVCGALVLLGLWCIKGFISHMMVFDDCRGTAVYVLMLRGNYHDIPVYIILPLFFNFFRLGLSL
jgi:hypothetical protein